MDAVRIYVGSETESASDEDVPSRTAACWLPVYAAQPVQPRQSLAIVMQPRLLVASCVLWAVATAVSVAVLVTDVIRLL